MKSENYLSAEIQEDGHVKVTINGPSNIVLLLLEEEAVAIFNSLKDASRSTTMKVMLMFFKNVAKEVLDIDI